jgi:hypothetical protein
MAVEFGETLGVGDASRTAGPYPCRIQDRGKGAGGQEGHDRVAAREVCRKRQADGQTTGDADAGKPWPPVTAEKAVIDARPHQNAMNTATA